MPRQWFRILAQADAAVADIYIYDIIGTSWFDESVSAKQFLEEMKALPEAVKTIRLHINSPGGDPFDATAMHNLLRDQAQKGRTIEVLIEGLAASAATIVSSAGDTIRIARNALMMVHNPQGFAMGDADTMLEMAQALEMVRDSIVASYRRHSALSDADLKALMAATTWMDADDAIAKGFATELMDALPVAAQFDPKVLKTLGAVPESFRPRVAALIRAQNEDWKVGGAKDLPLDEDRAWDADAADTRVRKWASKDGSGDKDQMDWPKYRKAFIVYDGNNEENFDGYKLGFADVVEGDLKAIKAGLVACRVVLNGGRGGVDLPADVIEAAKRFVDDYLGEPEEESDEKADATAVLAAVEKAGLSASLARELIEAGASMAQVAARIDTEVKAKTAADDRAREIRALCAIAKCPDLADSYIASSMAVPDIKTHLTVITAKLDQVQIDGLLPTDGGTKGKKARIDIGAVYAERNRLTDTKREG